MENNLKTIVVKLAQKSEPAKETNMQAVTKCWGVWRVRIIFNKNIVIPEKNTRPDHM